ncbi:DUF2484 family protein [Thalassorhabdomicrobium marinisediminis]|uniref:UDP-N-acetylmuramate--alanine ligase n=1 Tax=Thalassorhabdomicrobium marinisediminis TaxID=2170577 RepID=A0A2T7FXX0_9RHOB|nr:DUF2484 family protein [Thalassorhabdomicrobium marinisediminis]PVA07016.1 UDP-N-acetylmuramate--alanine ligase [Thalassorhabdomicrobium marinisediminis]
MGLSGPVLAAIVWVLAATLTALLPIRRQYVPGITLLVLAPVLILWLAVVHGWVWGVLGLAAFVSMFRNPLKYIYARLRGRTPEVSE